jgi:hypothetical protein
MSAPHCPRWDDLREAARSGRWTDSLREHLRACDVCVEGLWSRGIEDFAGELHQHVALRSPLDATAVWWKGRAAARAQSLADAERPFAVIQVACLGLGSLCAAVIAVWLLSMTPLVADAQSGSVAIPFVLLTTAMMACSILCLRIAK